MTSWQQKALRCRPALMSASSSAAQAFLSRGAKQLNLELPFAEELEPEGERCEATNAG